MCNVHQAELGDVIGMFYHLDQQSRWSGAGCCATRYDRIPMFGSEEINICDVVERQVAKDTKIENLIESNYSRDNRAFENLSVSIDQLDTRITQMSSSI